VERWLVRKRNMKGATRPRGLRVFCLCFPLLVIAWVLLVLYPNPANLVTSVVRLAAPTVDAAAVEPLADSLPSDPATIEKWVLQNIPYHYDWQVYGMPWYCPTIDEVLDSGTGDCKARAIVLASILEAKGIPYQINVSPTHVWVHYDGKVDNSIENAGAGFYEVDPETGSKTVHFPEARITYFVVTFWDGFWDPMPLTRKIILISGLVILFAVRLAWPRVRSRAAYKANLGGSSALTPVPVPRKADGMNAL
jgi:hypothetical protein